MSPEAQQLLAEAKRQQVLGRWSNARNLYARLLLIEPDHAELLHLFGILALQTGKPAEGLEPLSRASKIDPHNAGYQVTLGMALAALGRFQEAIQTYHVALALNPNSFAALMNLGNAFLAVGKAEAAIDVFNRAIKLEPRSAPARINLGCALRDAGRLEEAKSEFERANQLKPNFPEAEYLLGAVLADLEKPHDAIAAYRLALSHRPDFFQALLGLGGVLFAQDQFEEAEAIYARAMTLRAEDSELLCRQAATLIELGKSEEGIKMYRQAIKLQPDSVRARMDLGMALLGNGNFEEGWKEYEFRPAVVAFRAELPAKRWKGEPIHGMTLLIDEEQGLGDAIQFARFVPAAVKISGARIFLECAPELARLFASIEGVEKIIVRGESLPQADMHCPLLSLPLVMKIGRQQLWRSPYLQADEKLHTHWRSRLCDRGGLNTGLVWAGKQTHAWGRKRVVSPEMLAALGQVNQVRWISLQKRSAGLDVPMPPLVMDDWTDELHDMADTAALISALDLVISIDTSVAHLAGAMGKEVWLLLQAVPDWRWLGDDHSAWYPSIRMFRQEKRNAWAEPIANVAAELKKRAACQA